MKRLLAMLLALVMVFSLIACGKPADKTDDTEPNADAGTTEPKETTPIREDISDITPDILAHRGAERKCLDFQVQQFVR